MVLGVIITWWKRQERLLWRNLRAGKNRSRNFSRRRLSFGCERDWRAVDASLCWMWRVIKDVRNWGRESILGATTRASQCGSAYLAHPVYASCIAAHAYTPVPENLLENRSRVTNPTGIHARAFAIVPRLESWELNRQIGTGNDDGGENVWRINAS